MKPAESTIQLEEQFEKRFRKIPYFILFFTLFIAALLYCIWLFTYHLFVLGYWPILLLSGLLVHSWMILLVHEGAHKNLTGTKFDRWILNLASALVFLPFYGELFRKVHLYHHARTNLSDDPLWPDWKKSLFRKHRRAYILLEFLPLVVNISALFYRKSSRIETANIKNGASFELSTNSQRKSLLFYMFVSFLVAGICFYLFRPDPLFLAGSFFFANFWGSLRHWCEHTGYSENLESNTFFFPLGFGIGNHQMHHQNPSLSWVSLALGLRKREKTISIRKSFVGLWSDPRYIHYSSQRL